MDVSTTSTPNGANLPASAEERELVREVLSEEYRVLASALSAAWSASLVRTSIFLGVLSASVVALGLVVRSESFTQFALVILPLALFLGLATFERVVEIQREATIYITGMNRIRFFFQTVAPASRPFFILPSHDDDVGLYRSQGTGMHRRAPRFGVGLALVQTHRRRRLRGARRGDRGPRQRGRRPSGGVERCRCDLRDYRRGTRRLLAPLVRRASQGYSTNQPDAAGRDRSSVLSRLHGTREHPSRHDRVHKRAGTAYRIPGETSHASQPRSRGTTKRRMRHMRQDP